MELVQRAEHCGVSWVTVHGRTAKQRSEPASLEAIKLVGHILMILRSCDIGLGEGECECASGC